MSMCLVLFKKVDGKFIDDDRDAGWPSYGRSTDGEFNSLLSLVEVADKGDPFSDEYYSRPLDDQEVIKIKDWAYSLEREYPGQDRTKHYLGILKLLAENPDLYVSFG